MLRLIITIVCSFVWLLHQYSQENNPQISFADSTFWRTYAIDIRTNSINNSTLTFLIGDTLIYKKLFVGNYNFEGGIRENDNKIYAQLEYFKAQELGEILLYDFSVNINDTIVSNVTEGILSRLPVVTEIDTIELYNNEKRKRFFLNGGEDIWIEGIGSIYGFLYPAFEHVTNYTMQHLVCFKQGDYILYRNDSLCTNNCCISEIEMGMEYQSSANKIRCYPIPTKGTINIEIANLTSHEPYVLKIYNVHGIELYRTNSNIEKLQIDLSAFKGSVFYISLIFGHKNMRYKIIKL